MSNLLNLSPKQLYNYKVALVVHIALLLLGVILQNLFPRLTLTAIKYPFNVYFGLGYFNLLLISFLLFRKSKVVVWFCSIPASIVSILFVLFYTILLGFIPQTEVSNNKVYTFLGLHQITQSIPFLLVMFFFLTALGFVTLKRTIPFKKSNIGFLMNHFGLWLALLAGGLGSSDLQRLKMYLPYSEVVFTAQNQNDETIELPFAFELQKFKMEVFPSNIALFDKQKGEFIPSADNFFEAKTGNHQKILNFNIQVTQYLPEAFKGEDNVYLTSNEIGSTTASYVKVIIDGAIKEGWIGAKNKYQNVQTLDLNNQYALALLPPEPKRFASELKVYTDNGDPEIMEVDVNHPLSIKGWEVYQFSYNDKLGKWSNYSIVEIVKDPWLPIVYFGLFLMILGAFYLIWKGKDQKIIKQ
ncbi:cytochrome c biogenesis protein ResB [Flammeovirga yaeyamensis]|uniref:Cytochrome c biogenesis protein ResB n=1 Tax=Flammeovirga yaeyamensis TaxID=367791 RepID=A0AAX1NAI0_9BACT|nr:cytochrome c biogenesis protein ResB [Flammeovirga yaeyamensis]MBB3700092.1 hypothetical protein [Flammeovirga yaeyamensis]NMF37473.1 cytochrome c biogenesis protein ResB [Flammeovirga yaeyamensis]QWG04531.1 cytochrome c biogenesis protein ResB [Flammeovirga yaeyamensis]